MSEINPEKLKVAELRDELEKRGLDTKGTKPFLVDRLKEALVSEGGQSGGAADMDMDSNDSKEGEQKEEAEKEEEDEEEEKEKEEEKEMEEKKEQEKEKEKEVEQGEEVMEQEEETPEKQPEVKDEPIKQDNVEVKLKENGAAENGEPEKSGEEPAVKSEEAEKNGEPEKKAPVPTKPKFEEKGVKRKFGETGLSADELKPWNIREDEPELAEDFVCLDWYNSDLNLKIRHDDFLSGMPLNKESWSWIYAGARATHGVSTGKVYFEVNLLEMMKVQVWTDKDGYHLDLRVGWSTNTAARQLGEDTLSWCYSSAEGKKAHNKEFTEYGAKLEKGDVIGAFLDLGEETVTMTFTKNGETQGEAFTFPRSELAGEALFPHILSRNIKFNCNFGKDKDGKETKTHKEPLEGYTQVALVDAATLVRGDARIKTREECEFILMVGLPAVGKTTWAKKYAAQHPEKKFEIINAAVYLEKATVNGKSRKEYTDLLWEKVHHRITKALQDILRIASCRRRNIILDQTNVYVDAQLRKARPFEKMQRKCVVIVPSAEEWETRKKQQDEEGEKNIPDEAVNEMKANIAFPNDDNGVFDEIVFTDLQRAEAQATLEIYNKEAQDAGFGKKHLEYQSQWEMNKKMRGFGPMFGRGGPRGFPMGRGFGPMRPPMMRGGGRGGWGAPAFPPFGGGPGIRQGFGGGGYGYGGGNWGPYGGGGGQGGYGQYPGNRNWGGGYR